MPPPGRWPTSSSSIWWQRLPRGRSRPRTPLRRRRSARSATTRFDSEVDEVFGVGLDLGRQGAGWLAAQRLGARRLRHDLGVAHVLLHLVEARVGAPEIPAALLLPAPHLAPQPPRSVLPD